MSAKGPIEIGQITEPDIKCDRADGAIGKPGIAQQAMCARQVLVAHERGEGGSLAFEQLVHVPWAHALALRDPLNADTQNYIGYVYRRLRQLEPAMGHYQQALTLNPRHRGAREHLGEAYLVLGEPAKAEQMLTELENLCLIPCEEYDDLKQAIAVYRRLAAR